MYVRDTDKLPRNSLDPQTACEARQAKETVDNLEKSVQNAYRASRMIAGPESFRQFGPAVVIDVARSQNGKAAADRPVVFQPTNVRGEKLAAPTVLPLNVTEAEYSGCSMRGTNPLLPIPISTTVTMPERMPAPVAIPQKAQAPKYKNLCWALRNGAVDASQFDPAEYQALGYRCTQLGYAGACMPPPLVALWLDQQRRAGTLPHISVRTSDLDAIPEAPPLTGVFCPDSWKQGGLTGYHRGLGAPWGDAGSVPGDWGAGVNAPTGLSWKALLFFGVVGVGLVMVAGNGRR